MVPVLPDGSRPRPGSGPLPGPARRAGVAGFLALVAAAGPACADPALDAALRHLEADDVLVADAAVDALVAAGPAAVDSLLPRLDRPERDVRAGAIRALGRLGDRRAAPPLRDLLARSLASPGPDTFDDRYFRILAIRALGRLRDPEAVPLLQEAAGRPDRFERAWAGISLFLSRTDPGYSLVRECLADTSTAVRALTVEAVVESDDPRVRELVLETTRDPDWVVRDAAYRALGRLAREHLPADPEVRSALERGAAEDPSGWVRRTAAWALSPAGETPAMEK